MADINRGLDLDRLRNVPGDRVRNVSTYDRVNGLHLNDFACTSQGNDADEPRRLYGFEIEYRNVFTVDRREAERMAKTLRTIDARMDKVIERFGRPTTFGAYLLRVANAIGATRFIFQNGRSKGWSHEDHDYDICDLWYGALRVDGLVREWMQENQQKEEAAS